MTRRLLSTLGLPSYFLFTVILKFIEPFMKSTTSMGTIANQLFSVLAKLRLNFKDKVVADMLCVSPGMFGSIMKKFYQCLICWTKATFNLLK